MQQQQVLNRYYVDQKTRTRVGGAISEYLGFFDESRGGDVEARKTNYRTMINHYYDLVTDFYVHAWAQSFHFAPRFQGESFEASLARCEHFFALRLGLAPGMKVLDVGCGIGGPMRSIARFSGATIEGVNNNDYQLKKVREYNEALGLADQCSGFKGDFMSLQVADETYDAAYAIEATCHAPNKTRAFEEIYRVLKPGTLFAAHEWCMTSSFDPTDAEHRRIKKGVEEGDGLPDIATIPETLEALRAAGFELVEHFDASTTADPKTPWYLPLVGETKDLLAIRRGRIGRLLASRTIGTLEAVGIAPKGSTNVSGMLDRAAESLIAAGERGIFTPNYFLLARRPDRTSR